MIGIAGVGMSATALLLKERGDTVSGSDAETYGQTTPVLARAGITFTVGYDPRNIPPDVDFFVIGRNAKLAPSENAEVRAAFESGKKIWNFAEVLGELTNNRENAVVVGSYGKSTTTSLIAHIARHSGTPAGYFIGAEPVQSTWLPAPAGLGSASLFILEGDEYPSGHTDSRAKFMHLHPTDVVLTAVVHDHVNVYPTIESYEQPFREILSMISGSGMLVACADEPHARRLAGASAVTYGLTNGRFVASNILPGQTTRFTLSENGNLLGDIETSLLGAHNVQNIAGAAAYILTKKIATFAQVAAAVQDFKGIRRRLDNIAPTSRIPVYEGFGSSFEKARAAIEALQLHYATQPLIIVFEPHAFGWRNRANLAWYDTVFEGATQVYIAPPAVQGAKTHDQLTHEEILFRTGGLPYENPASVIRDLKGNEVVLVLTSGDLSGTLEEFVRSITQRFS